MFACAALTVLVAGPGCGRQRVLDSSQPIHATVAGGGRQLYRVDLGAGECARVIVDQHEADLVLSLSSGTGAADREIDMREFGPESATLLSDRRSTFTIAIRTRAPASAPVPYEVSLDAPAHPASAIDRRWPEAERLESEGKRLAGDSSPQAPDRAIASLDGALSLWRETGNQTGQASTLARIGDMLDRRGRLDDAAAVYADALTIARALGRPHQIAMILNNLGAGQGRRGLLRESRASLDEALELWRRLSGVDVALATTLTNQGGVFLESGDYQHALERFLAARSTFHALTDAREPIVLSNLGVSYRALGDLDAAQQYLTDALPLFTGPRAAAGKARVLVRLGQIAIERGELPAAAARGTEALALGRDANDPSAQADALDLLGQVAAGSGAETDALHRYEEARTLYAAAGARRGVATILQHQGVALRAAGRLPQARDALQHALAIRREVGLRDAEADTRFELALVERDAAALSSARAHLAGALALVEDVRGRVAGEYSRTTYWAARQKYFAAYIDVLMQLHHAHPSGGYAAEAFATAERERARALVDALRESGAEVRHGAGATLVEDERREREQLDFWSNRLARLADRKGADEEAAEARRQVDAHLTAYRTLDARIRALGETDARAEPQILDLPETQRRVVDARTRLLRFAVGDRSYAWLVGPQSVKVVTLPSKAEIDRLAGRVAAQVRSPPSMTDRSARDRSHDAELLSHMLLGPFAADLGDHRLVIVAEGALQLVPFAALPDPVTGAPLVAGHEIVMAPSASALAAVRGQGRGRMPAAGDVAVLADPVYEQDDPRLAGRRRATSSPAPSNGGNGDVGRLPLSQDEGEWILGLAPPSRRLGAFGFDATRETAAAALRGYRIVHFAVHARSDAARPELSTLIFSLYDRDGARRNGYLRLHDITTDLALEAALVVLSACETVRGKDVPGEGLMSLARTFLGAGAGGVIGSLYTVREEPTLELMKTMYQELLGPHALRPAAALRAAQLRMLAEPRFADPFYWSAFIYIGDLQ